MAVYKIFPTKDTSIYSYYPTKNAGLDEILDISLYESIESTREVSRAILAFSNTEISDLLTAKINNSNYKAYLKLYLANASEIPLDYTLYCYPISSSWNMGTGRAADTPSITDGVSWKYKDQFSGSAWFTTFPAYTISLWVYPTGAGNFVQVDGQTTPLTFIHSLSHYMIDSFS
jgi:hypothetical protein